MKRTTSHGTAGPLSGIRVIDLTTSYAGPTATMYLADMGADVIKIERPGRGDDTRSWGPPFIEEESAWFASANRNKRSVALDLHFPEGRAVLAELLKDADVLISNMVYHKAAALGLDAEAVCGEFPSLVYCVLSGFGISGPAAALPGYDLAAQARSGMMSVTGAKGHGPQRVSTALSDIATGMCATAAISSALVRSTRTGVGEFVEVSLLDSDLALMAPRIASFLAGEPEPAPSGGTDSVLAIYQAFRARDREIVVAVGNDAMWTRFCAAIGLPELGRDERHADNAKRREQRHALIPLIQKKLGVNDAGYWLDVLHSARVPASLVQSLSEVVTDPQVVARESILREPGSIGVRSPFRFASVPAVRNERFPDLGQHTAEVLSEHGYSGSQIDALKTVGAIETMAGVVSRETVS